MTAFLPAMVYGDSQLKWLLPGVQDAFAKTRADAAREGITVKVEDFGGARTEGIVAQLIRWRDQAVKNGEPYYRVSPYATTKHALGAAVDFEVVTHPNTMTLEQARARVGALARPHGLVWGGTFSAPPDPWHLESQQSLDQLKPRWDAWKLDPAFPRMGAADWAVLALAAVAAVGIVLLLRSA